jgi:tRNA dimethylallyltransferase
MGGLLCEGSLERKSKKCSKGFENVQTDDAVKLVIIQGPTASGKSDLAVLLAEKTGAEIVNADSMQVYRRMDIGTAKPSGELRRRVPHHLVDLVDPDQPFSAADFRRAAEKSIENLHARGKHIIVCGGTGLYIRALTKGLAESPGGDESVRRELRELAARCGGEELHRRLSLVDPVSASRLHPNDQLRIIRALEVYRLTGKTISGMQRNHGFADNSFHCLKIGLKLEREALYRRIDNRVEWMIGNGLVEEVRDLLDSGYSPSLKSMRSLGYRHICEYLTGGASLQEAVDFMKRDTRRYAKRQMTWFNQDTEINWIEYPENVAIIVQNVIDFFD